jgi:uncharacterized short protein YbdD (DUF466 family)
MSPRTVVRACVALRGAWAWLRRITGDDAYERYRDHQLACHPGGRLLDRRAFCAEEQRRKWSGVSRCC